MHFRRAGLDDRAGVDDAFRNTVPAGRDEVPISTFMARSAPATLDID